MANEVVIFAALGPNPAPLTELVWKLARSGQFQRFEIHVVVEKSGRRYLDGEVLAPRGALEQLRRVLGHQVVIDEPVVHEVLTVNGELLDDDADPDAFRIYAEALWRAARTAVDSGADRPVIFGLIAGRRRTMTALASSVFQLLARPRDRLVDVRVTDARVEGGTGFFFPEQDDQYVQARHGKELVDVRGIDVVLVDVDVPRLRAFVPADAFDSLGSAQLASQGFLEASAPPQLEIRLGAGEVWVDGEAWTLSPSSFVWLSYLAAERAVDDGWVAVRDLDRLRKHLERVSKTSLWSKLPSKSPYARVLQGDDDEDDELRNVRTKTGRSLRRLCRGQRAALQQMVPKALRRKVEGGASSFQQIPLDPAFIKVSE